jgi:hypothetical protein
MPVMPNFAVRLVQLTHENRIRQRFAVHLAVGVERHSFKPDNVSVFRIPYDSLARMATMLAKRWIVSNC